MDNQKSTDRREGRRVTLNCPVRVILNPDGQRSECDALLLEASELGARVVLGSEVRMGEVVELVPLEGPDFAVHGRVVWIAEFRARHENHLGIQFSEPHIVPSWRG